MDFEPYEDGKDDEDCERFLEELRAEAMSVSLDHSLHGAHIRFAHLGMMRRYVEIADLGSSDFPEMVIPSFEDWLSFMEKLRQKDPAEFLMKVRYCRMTEEEYLAEIEPSPELDEWIRRVFEDLPPPS